MTIMTFLVKHLDEVASIHPINVGVPKGSLLSSYLYFLFTDLSTNHNTITITLTNDSHFDEVKFVNVSFTNSKINCLYITFKYLSEIMPNILVCPSMKSDLEKTFGHLKKTASN